MASGERPLTRFLLAFRTSARITLSTSGVFSGTPTRADVYSFALTAEDNSADGPFFDLVNYSTYIVPASPSAPFTVAATPAMATVMPGQSAEYAIAITPVNGFNARVHICLLRASGRIDMHRCPGHGDAGRRSRDNNHDHRDHSSYRGSQ